MDTSETYIKMHKGLPQELIVPSYCDIRQFVVCAYHKCLVEYNEGYLEWQCPEMKKAQATILYGDNYSEHGRDSLWGKLQKSDDWCGGKHWIRLLTQDQLQEMVVEDMELPQPIRECQPTHNKVWNMLSSFYAYVRDIEHNFTSMEQLWLAFVMKERYDKVWVDGEWVSGG